MARCNYCTGDANDLSILHHLPTEALLTIYDLPRDPVQQFQADRNDGAQAVLKWLYDNGFKDHEHSHVSTPALRARSVRPSDLPRRDDRDGKGC